MPDVFVSKPAGDHGSHGGEDAHQRHNHSTPKSLKGKHTKNPLAAIQMVPKKAKFIGTDEEEKILLVLRRHPITNLRWIITGVALLLVPVVVSLLPAISALPPNIQVVGMLIWYLVTIAYVFEQFLGWYFNVFVVTDERIFDVDFAHLTYREITDASIDQIQDVTTKLGGVLGTVLNYGTVFIQTAGAKPMIEFEQVPSPDEVANVLRELRVQEEQEKLEGRVR